MVDMLVKTSFSLNFTFSHSSLPIVRSYERSSTEVQDVHFDVLKSQECLCSALRREFCEEKSPTSATVTYYYIQAMSTT